MSFVKKASYLRVNRKLKLTFATSNPDGKAIHLDIFGYAAIQYFTIYMLHTSKPLCGIPVSIQYPVSSIYHNTSPFLNQLQSLWMSRSEYKINKLK